MKVFFKILILFFTRLSSVTTMYKCDIYNTSNSFQYTSEEHKENIDCYYTHVEDDLPSADEMSFSSKTIFFIETACKGGLDSREVCSVEAAARANPNRSIVVLFAGPVPSLCTLRKPMIRLHYYKTVKLYRIHIEQYSKGTPLQNWLAQDSWRKLMKKSIYPIRHTSNALRFLTLYKFGGTYLDLDVMLLQSLSKLPKKLNWVGKEDIKTIGSALISFSRDVIGRHLAYESLRILMDTYKPRDHRHNSVGVLRKALQTICTVWEVGKMSATNCEGFAIYSPEYFYAIPYYRWNIFFRFKSANLKDTWYAFHMWNKLTRDTKIFRGSFYDRLAQKFCPKVYSLLK